nr:hypothetical protein [Candidatus Sigynarchaeota archaeon]
MSDDVRRRLRRRDVPRSTQLPTGREEALRIYAAIPAMDEFTRRTEMVQAGTTEENRFIRTEEGVLLDRDAVSQCLDRFEAKGVFVITAQDIAKAMHINAKNEPAIKGFLHELAIQDRVRCQDERYAMLPPEISTAGNGSGDKNEVRQADHQRRDVERREAATKQRFTKNVVKYLQGIYAEIKKDSGKGTVIDVKRIMRDLGIADKAPYIDRLIEVLDLLVQRNVLVKDGLLYTILPQVTTFDAEN